MAGKLSPICSNFLLGDRFQEDKVFELVDKRPLASAVLDDPVFAGKFAARYPDTKTILRIHSDDANHNRYRDAKQWIAVNLAKVPDGVLIQDTNEPADKGDQFKRAVEFSADMGRELTALGRGGVLLNLSVGNPNEKQLDVLQPLVEVIRASKGLLSLGAHEYLPNRAAYPDYWLVGRIARIVAKFGPLPIFITELGVVQRLNTGRLNGDVSWKGLGYSQADYARAVIEMWHKVYDPLGVHSVNSFLHGGFAQHKDYDTSDQEEYNDFMDAHAPRIDYKKKPPSKGQLVSAAFDFGTPKWLVRNEAGAQVGDIQPGEQVKLLSTPPLETGGWRRAEIIRFRRGGQRVGEGREFVGYKPITNNQNPSLTFVTPNGKIADPDKFGKPQTPPTIPPPIPHVPDMELSATARLIAAHAIQTGGLTFFAMLPPVIAEVQDVVDARNYLEALYNLLNAVE